MPRLDWEEVLEELDAEPHLIGRVEGWAPYTHAYRLPDGSIYLVALGRKRKAKTSRTDSAKPDRVLATPEFKVDDGEGTELKANSLRRQYQFYS